jgi:hypothetical protein
MPTIWSEDELNQYTQEGYDALVMATGCLWATQVFPDYPSAFNYTQPFEFDFFVGGDRVSGRAEFTSSFERDYVNNAGEPANHSFHWEYDGGYVSITEISALVELPIDCYELERATWNTQRLDAFRSRDVEMDDMRYELNTSGAVEAYIQDKDGLRILRKWHKPAAAYVGYTFSTSTLNWGILRSVGDVTNNGAVINSWGELRSVDGETVMGGPWGIIRNIYKETSNLRMEYRRRGLPLSDTQDFEIPMRQQVYVRHYVQARSYEREGDGQDLELAAHYQSRYEAGIQRMMKRKPAMHYQQKSVFGGSATTTRRRLPLVRLPWNFGERVR